MMTSNVDDGDRRPRAGSGALAFLKKPFYPADIDAVLTRFYGADARSRTRTLARRCGYCRC